ncbi:MAG: hypothetical protein LC798_12695 [Chloroflexi bacterium]|nr:hypothetical protein [Chloroflexota bacterium]
MAFRWEGGRSITDLFDEGPLDLAARRMAEAVQEYLLDTVREYTPVGETPPGVSAEDFRDARGGRRPGTLRDSWEEGEIEVITTTRIRVSVLTRDPVAPYVEYPTRPHVIRPTSPRVVDEDGTVHGGILRFWNRATGQMVFAAEVHHPGTEGSYMMTQAIQDTARFWPEIVRDELVRWSREQVGVG